MRLMVRISRFTLTPVRTRLPTHAREQRTEELQRGGYVLQPRGGARGQARAVPQVGPATINGPAAEHVVWHEITLKSLKPSKQGVCEGAWVDGAPAIQYSPPDLRP